MPLSIIWLLLREHSGDNALRRVSLNPGRSSMVEVGKDRLCKKALLEVVKRLPAIVSLFK